jgi:hypothetical protein
VAHRRGHPDKVGAALARCGGAVQAVPREERRKVQTRIGTFECRGWAAYGDVYSMNLRLVFGGCMWGVAEDMGLDIERALCICLPGEKRKDCPYHELTSVFGDGAATEDFDMVFGPVVGGLTARVGAAT